MKRRERGRKRALATAIATIMFVLLSLFALASVSAMNLYGISGQQAEVSAQKVLTDMREEQLLVFTLPGGTILVLNNGSTTAKVLGIAAVSDGTGQLQFTPDPSILLPGKALTLSLSQGDDTAYSILTSVGSAYPVSPSGPYAYYSITLAPSSTMTAPGNLTAADLLLTSYNGYSYPVQLYATNVPGSVSVSFVPPSFRPSPLGGTAVMEVNVSCSAAPGAYTIVVNGVGTDGLHETASFYLTVT